MAHEFQESFNAPAECSQNMCSLGDFALVRPDAQLAQHDRQSNKNLENAGILPAFDLKMWNGDDEKIELKNPFKPSDIATKEMKGAGVKATESLDKDGQKVTTVETKSGVKVSVTEGKEITKPDGTKVKGPDTVKVDGPVKANKAGNIWSDAKGKEIVHRNKDGSVTIDSGEGVFVKQDSHGVKKATAIRDGKSFQEFDPNSPLGDMRPPELPRKK